MLNRITLMGRLVRDPELKYTSSNTPVCTITLAVERDFARAGEPREADFIDVTAWGVTAEFVAKWFRKGLLVACEGRLQSRRWKDRFEQNRVSFEVQAENVYFAERAEKTEAPSTAYGGPPPSKREAAGTTEKPAPRGWNPGAADVDAGEDMEYMDDLYKLPSSDFEGLDDDEDVPF